MICEICGNRNVKEKEIRGDKGYKCDVCGFLKRYEEKKVDENFSYWENESEAEKITEAKRKLYEFTLERAEKKCKGRKLLDVGCGIGSFLSVAEERGWESEGIEPDGRRVETGKQNGLSIRKGVLGKSDGRSGKYDLVTYWDVLIMVENPLEELKRAEEMLSENGMIYARVRNATIMRWMENIWAGEEKRFGIKNPAVFHPNNFEARTAEYLGKNANLLYKRMNGRLTTGDAYGVSGKQNVMEIGKRIIEMKTDIIAGITGNKLLLSPTLEFWFKR